jgi:uncharacterized protein YhbP (UPF0306 family)
MSAMAWHCFGCPIPRAAIQPILRPIRVAATVAPDYSDMDDIRGVQISGRAHVITGASDCANARSLLEARYPCVKRLSEGESALREAYENISFYRLEPACMVLINNSRGFGHKDTLDVENKQRLAP